MAKQVTTRGVNNITSDNSEVKETENVVEVKKARRGLSTATGTTRLKFSNEKAKPNGLFITHVDEVSVSNILIGEQTSGLPSFNGLEIPKLVITLASNEEDVDKRQYVSISFNAVESNVNTIPGGKESWKVDSVLDWSSHFLKTFLKREFTAEEYEALSLTHEDFDETGAYVPIEPEEVIESWNNYFNNFVNIVNTSNAGNPIYKSKEGKPISLWTKLIRYIKPKKSGNWRAVNSGELALPTFVGEGVIEVFKTNILPSIRINVISESIKPMDLESKPKAPNLHSSPNFNGGVPIDDSNPFGGGFDSGSEDLPF